jgi:hypothetical protein
MAATKERYQNPVITDTVILRLFIYNSNNFANVASISTVDIYALDGTDINNKRLVASITSADIKQDSVGHYYVEVLLEDAVYTIGNYIDVWTMNMISVLDQPSQITNYWTIYPDLWYTAPIPVVYDFNFNFRPSRFRKNSKRYIIIQVTPNVPKGTDLQRYYENLAIIGNLFVSIEQKTGECLPKESDLRMIAERVPVTFREKMYGYYQLDTTDLDIGIYDIWFEINLGDNVYISERNQFQIFD